ncbi:hypothetical protein JCM14202_472 [Agrilactobacillus composti DSM 18527 = JCM 14202]|nr:DUF3290 family protein [Agrilactobacillus composti]GAF38650.1 hypothetical protein JCM14202_472 [Agrilactobacillus composti DSM 18527 = JCM 14202]
MMTTMWTYQYFQNHETNRIIYLRFGLIILSAILLIITLIAYLRQRNNSKNRELLIIFILSTLLFVTVQTGHWQETRTGFNNSNQVVRFMQSVAKAQHTTPGKIATNQQNLSSGMIVKVGTNFYSVKFNNDASISSYELTKTALINSKISYDPK